MSYTDALSSLNGYVAFYNGKREEIYATSMWDAKQKAAKLFNLPLNGTKIQRLSVVLAEVGTKPVAVPTDF